MRVSSMFRGVFLALAMLAVSVPMAHAATGTVRIKVVKAGFIFGGSGGSGTLTLGGKTYYLSIGGLSAGLVIGAAELNFSGTASHLNKPGDIAGVYGAVGAGVAADHGPGIITLGNQKGVLLELTGRQRGLLVNVDLSGMVISLK
ncbi:MAG TPA: hypothetical protein VG894_10425 [Bauldia sp.]|nr:hypothetical protein [Bauldia sp.]